VGLFPRLPDNAPFAPAQRAWLDGFLAGWFGNGGAASPMSPQPATPPVIAEEFPWHDPVLSLDERLELADGRPRERVLMAAMAQLDCGQCGYLCRTYAEAIASGAETSLARCVPGGKATSRKLRELMTAPGLAPATAPALPIVTAPPASSLASPAALTQFPARLRQAQCLNQGVTEKDTRLIVLAPEESVAYEVGSSLGVVARNSPDLVGAIIERLGAAPDAPVLSPDGIERPLIEALSAACEIRRPSDQAIEVLASRAHDRDESQILQAMAEGYPGVGPEDADLLDLLEAFPSARPPLSELVSALNPLEPRLYSIASSPKRQVGEIHLTVAAVRYEKRARRRNGVASTFLCDRVAPGEGLSVFLQPSHSFRLAPPGTPIIMIGPGTGIAPFRAFLQERRATGAGGRNWLFFGNPHRDTDFFFENELTGYCRDGLLTRLDTAFSRDQPAKVYVQHRMLEQAAELWSWLEEGAHLYVCGDAQRMARDVERGLAYIVAKQGRLDPAGAKAYLARLAQKGRYQKDVY
jgi:sulfite reductase (NADPH) flavoprotein alpha-component